MNRQTLYRDLEGSPVTLPALAQHLALTVGVLCRNLKQSGRYAGMRNEVVMRRRAEFYRDHAVPMEEQKRRVSERHKARAQAEPEKVARIQKASRLKRMSRDPFWHCFSERLSRRKITLDQFHARYESQDFSCAICGDFLDLSLPNSVHVDHEHATARHRGLLCSGCNIGLGAFKDNPAALACAAEYVSR